MPKEILSKLCKKFGLKKPKYDNNELIIESQYGIFTYPTKQRDASLIEAENSSRTIDSDDESVTSKDNDPRERKINKYEEQLALDALNSWEDITKV